MGEFGGLAGRVLGFNGRQNGCWYWILSNEIALSELDLPSNTTLDGLATAPAGFDPIRRRRCNGDGARIPIGISIHIRVQLTRGVEAMCLSEGLLLNKLIIFILTVSLEVRYAFIGAQSRGPRNLRLYETSTLWLWTISKRIVVAI